MQASFLNLYWWHFAYHVQYYIVYMYLQLCILWGCEWLVQGWGGHTFEWSGYRLLSHVTLYQNLVSTKPQWCTAAGFMINVNCGLTALKLGSSTVAVLISTTILPLILCVLAYWLILYFEHFTFRYASDAIVSSMSCSWLCSFALFISHFALIHISQCYCAFCEFVYDLQMQ